MLGTIPKTFSNDTLDISSVDSMSLDEHIEIKIPEARARENRLMAQNNFVQHINEKSRNTSHNHLAVDNGTEALFKNLQASENQNQLKNQHSIAAAGLNGDSKCPEAKEHHIHRSHSHSSMKKAHHGHMPNGNCVNGGEQL